MRSNKGRICILVVFIISVVLIVVGFFVLQNMVKTCKEKKLTIKEGTTQGSYDKDDFYVDVTVSKQWLQNGRETGAQYDGVFYNNSDYDINRWTIEVEVPENSKIDSYWNGEYNLDQQVILITSVDYNEIIERQNKETFGWIMYTDKPFEVSSITVTGYKIYSKEDFILYWILISSIILLISGAIIYIIIELRLRTFKIKQKEDKNIILQSLNTFANFIDAKDPYTKGHSTRVAKYTSEIARRMGMSEAERDKIAYIALLHDVGKIGITNEILNKPGKLTQEERKIIQMHTTIGADILKDFTALPGITDGARYHHESFDGHGYPNGLKGKDIPLFARIICVADSYDAMSSDRCYRKRLSDQEILKELAKCAGTQFDPDIVRYMIDMITDGYIQKLHGGSDGQKATT